MRASIHIIKSMATEYKCNRHGDYKRLASAALCASDDLPSGLLKGKLPSSSPEDLKRFKAGLRESTIKARERVKMGAQSHALTSAFDYEQQKVEERGKNGVPNKRTRTSMVDQKADVRPNTPARSSRSVERDREVKSSVIKAVSKLGRPPTRKLLGRKTPRQKYSTFTATTDYLLHVSDDGHEELLAAANAVINPGCALSSLFWRLMDPRFRFVSDAAVAYVKQIGDGLCRWC
nr:hypothetical protein [Tanacetum cinerariifolium]